MSLPPAEPVLTVETARRLDRAENAWWSSYMATLARHDNNVLGVHHWQDDGDGAFAWCCKRAPSLSLWNALAFPQQLDADGLASACRFFATHGCRIWLIVVPDIVDGAALQRFHAAGLAHVACENQFWAPVHPAPADADTDATRRALDAVALARGVTLREATADDRDEFVRVYVDSYQGSGLPPDVFTPFAIGEWALFHDPEWRVLVAEVDGRPQSFGCLHLRDGVGSASGAWTAPEARGRGAQQALIRGRMALAARLGCDLVLSQTDVATTSGRNLQRAGMRIAWTKAIWSTPDAAS